MAPTRFDQAARRIARVEPHSFFAWLFTRFHKYLRFRRWLDTRTTPEARDEFGEQTGDTLAELEEVSRAAPFWMFVQEFQTEPDADMFGRMTRQGGQMWLDHRPDPLPGSRYQLAFGIVNLTGTRASMPGGRLYKMPGVDGVFTGQRPRERWLADESGVELMDRVESGELGPYLLAFVPVMQKGGEEDTIKRCLELIGREPDSRRRGDIGLLALVLAELKDWFPAWQEALRGWNVRESQTVLKFKREGAAEALQQRLRKQLTQRFGALPTDFVGRIEAIDDPQKLDQLLDQVSGLKAFEDLQF